MTSPSPAALDAALGIISYLKRTRKLGITYGPDEKLCLYTDSSWGNENPRPMARDGIRGQYVLNCGKQGW